MDSQLNVLSKDVATLFNRSNSLDAKVDLREFLMHFFIHKSLKNYEIIATFYNNVVTSLSSRFDI